MSTAPLADHAHRQQALDIGGSFIVQAPAGSGKTELLTLRFLKLLAVCEQPEQVLAITFTRKAANEMRQRIAGALEWAASCLANQTPPANALDQQRLAIASQVLAQDAKLNWHLRQNPARLRVQTIDSFCFYLANQLPVLSQLGGNPQVSEDVTPCFVDAISNTLSQLETGSPLSDDIAALLSHLDNDLGKVERLLISLLLKRDQWLGDILEIRAGFADARTYLQQSLAELVTESLLDARTRLLEHEAALIPLLNYAADNLQRAGLLDIADYQPLAGPPPPDFAAMPYWHFLLQSLLTKSKSAPAWRRTVNVNNGFPTGDRADKAQVAECKQKKADMIALLQTLSVDDDVLAALDYLRMLPDPALTAESWLFLSALTRVLAHLSTELMLSFRKFRVIDYAQTSSAARTALGDEDAPTDLALALDQVIQHVLVDEFQDTSQMQMDILRQITASWSPGDGRTLFLVGDAMQSCYAFRNANVGIYLQVRVNGLGNIPLTPLTLETNFRSQENIVAWVNQVFTTAFPQHANISRGAVPYTPSVAVHKALDNQRAVVTLLVHEQEEQDLARQAEANLVVRRIQQLQQQYPTQSIAILVRARPHLNHIIPALRSAGIEWQSTDIDRLVSLPVIEDLLCLTRAILNQANRLAWLALLRAPWCGFTINDLHAVASQAGAASIWSVLQNPESITSLSTDGRVRLAGILPALQFAMLNRTRVGLRNLLEQCWQMLGGAAIVTNPAELDSVAHYLNLVSEYEVGYGIADIDRFYDTVAAAFVPNRTGQVTAARPPIHVLTMHKAKGLEFDHVLLPGLARLPKSDDKPLLQWHQRLNGAGISRLFLATLSPSGADSDPLYELLRYEQQYKTTLENTRLLYIAVTRARASVQLVATLPRKASGEIQPPRSSLLSRIWRELRNEPQLTEAITVNETDLATATDCKIPRDNTDYPSLTPIRRLQHPLPPAMEELQRSMLASGYVENLEREQFSLQLEAIVGTLIHRSLEAIGKSGNLTLDDTRLAALRCGWELQLRNLVTEAAVASHVQRVESDVTRTLRNQDLHWLFTQGSIQDEFEVALTRQEGQNLRHYKIDRSVVDAAGTRWIIDYKTSAPAAAQAEADFLAEQRQLYSPQLDTYRTLYAQLEQRPLKCALLFTSLGKLVEV